MLAVWRRVRYPESKLTDTAGRQVRDGHERQIDDGRPSLEKISCHRRRVGPDEKQKRPRLASLLLAYPGTGRPVSRHLSMLSEIILTDDDADWVSCAYRAASRRMRSPSDCR